MLRRFLNLALYLSFCLMIGTGLLLAFRLLPGSRGGQGLEMLGWSRHQWGDLHTWISYGFISLVVLHLAMNWAWLTKVAARGRPWLLILGILFGLVLIFVFMAIPVHHDGRGEGRGRRGGHWQGKARIPAEIQKDKGSELRDSKL